MKKYLELFKDGFDATVAEKTEVKNWPYVGYSPNEGVVFTVIPEPYFGPADNEILYTSSYGNIVTPFDTTVFGANIVSNTYEDGKGVITFDGDVTNIGYNAFEGCSSLKSIVIPDSVTNIDVFCFLECSSLTSITIPNNVTSIGDGAFCDCSSLTSITIPNSVTSIGASAFRGCSSLTSPVYNAHCFAYMPTSYSGAYTIPEGIKQIAGDAFYNCSSLTSITIPNSVTSIEGRAFYGCSNITSVTWNAKNCNTYNFGSQVTSFEFGNEVEVVPSSLCMGMDKLTSVTIPNSVTSIEYSAFYNCSSLTSVTIGESVTSIGDRIFEGCSSLTSVTIPNSVTSIGWYAFYNCSSLTSITCEATIPPQLGLNNQCPTVTAVYVPAESVNVYKAADNWSYYASKIQAIQ